MMTRSAIAVAAYATLLALLLPEGGDCFAPPLVSSISRTTTSTSISTGAIIIQAKTSARTSKKKYLHNLHMSNNSEIEGTDRVLSCLPYLIPLLDGDRYGKYLFYLVPALGMADSIVLGPFKAIYSVIPFAQLIAFIGLSVLSRNPDIPRPVRFNIQQALILDIALIFPSLLGQLPIPIPAIVANSGNNFVYLAIVGSVVYSVVSNVTGKVPDKIPVISEAAGSSVQ
ncbi:hypothetical protein FRACYDRAFT_237180 [Fragilariopsis cylindrus CCMP1102]|uniref:Protein TIC 20 n=1 Tax=Fragilariopsis cylindrus CCMP1102 TaxID=635003 RepID=A0A1E7FL46_9STRA|nr:hypothetical protein FRACYDRAFT_237180 [Fragilariopsis cylindrus CCMP1102]|eukprot:OEU18898.1 hypothetical protein FRACYDRAFT_237180 [Fragilariopsis cylindrus CCMP1102]